MRLNHSVMPPEDANSIDPDQTEAVWWVYSAFWKYFELTSLLRSFFF